MFELSFSARATDDMLGIRHSNKALRKKLIVLLVEIRTTPYSGTGKPEPLRHELSGCWSRRLDTKNRLVYRVDEQANIVEIISAKGRYAR